jgi:PII-like signaling protein
MMRDVTVVRIYLTEAQGHIPELLRRLQREEKLSGVSIFRAVSGFGEGGKLHTASLMDLSLNLPVVVEFFDAPEKVESVLEHLDGQVKKGHMLIWNARTNA